MTGAAPGATNIGTGRDQNGVAIAMCLTIRNLNGIPARILGLAVTFVMVAALTSACIGDSIRPRKRIAGDYYLVQFEGHYFFDKGVVVMATGPGPLSGAVDALGWDDSHIVLSRLDGWVVITLATDEVEVRLTDQAFALKRRATPSIGSIKVRPASEVWRDL